MPAKKTRTISELKKLDPEHIRWLVFQKTIKLKMRLGLFDKKNIKKDSQIRARLNDLLNQSIKQENLSVQRSIRKNKEKVKKREKIEEKRKKNVRLKEDSSYVKSKKFERDIKEALATIIYVKQVSLENPKSMINIDASKKADEYLNDFKKRFLFHPKKEIRTIARQKYERVLVELGVKK